MSQRFVTPPRVQPCREQEYTYVMSDNEVGAVFVHVVVVPEELDRSDTKRGRQPVARPVLGGRPFRADRPRHHPRDAQHFDAGGEGAVACGGGLGGEGASQSALCLEKINRMVSMSLTVCPIQQHDLIHGHAALRGDGVAGFTLPGVKDTYIGRRHGGM
jgi:hypothetical protein